MMDQEGAAYREPMGGVETPQRHRESFGVCCLTAARASSHDTHVGVLWVHPCPLAVGMCSCDDAPTTVAECTQGRLEDAISRLGGVPSGSQGPATSALDLRNRLDIKRLQCPRAPHEFARLVRNDTPKTGGLTVQAVSISDAPMRRRCWPDRQRGAEAMLSVAHGIMRRRRVV